MLTSEVDFHGFLTKPAQNPMATQFLDITRFKKFKIDQRADIIWGDWEMCFPFAALYAGDLDVDSLGNKKKVSRKPLRKVVSPVRSGRSVQKRSSDPKNARVRVKA